MIMQPAVIALFVGSILVCLMVLYAGINGISILESWDLKSGSELQLGLERKTYLISTLMGYVFGYQLISLFLFIFTADRLSGLFTGAMCAAGTLKVNVYGYPALVFKMLNFILGGVWLIVNYTDSRAFDYPLIKTKYLFLLIIAPLVIAESVIQGAYFLNLKADVITSCCGSLFSPEGPLIEAGLAALPVMPMEIGFYSVMTVTAVSGLYFYLRGRAAAGLIFSVMAVVTFAVSAAALISFISLYIYELPTHHCPFCILQKEYHYIGYLMYAALFGGVVSGAGVGVLLPFRQVESLRDTVPRIQKKLTIVTLFLYLLFAAIASFAIMFSGFRLGGY
jgi:hypothetical protein